MNKIPQLLKNHSFILGLSFVIGCGILGLTLGHTFLKIKNLDRTVVVKGLAEKEVLANVVIWNIRFRKPSNDLPQLYINMDKDVSLITNFLISRGVTSSEITINPPDIVDKLAQDYSNNPTQGLRFIGEQGLTVYSTNINLIRSLTTVLPDLGKQGISFTGNARYDKPTQYIYNDLNAIKPEMIQKATEQAREVALKFANDSKSKLGKIKKASQGQFTINDRDTNNPHIKVVRIVSTIEYYLSD